MPELPEVEVVRAGLAQIASGARVLAVSVFDERAIRRHEGDAQDFAGRLEGARLEPPQRRGKFLWLPVAGRDEALLAHLGMSGQLLVRAPDAGGERHLRARIALDGPAGRYDVAFVDQRRFGSLAVDPLDPGSERGEGARAPAAGRKHGATGLPDAAEAYLDGRTPRQIAHIARDPLDPRFDDERFLAELGRRRGGVKAALLDQSLLSGVGNIYADESLWRAGLHGARPGVSIPPRKRRELLRHLREVFARALAEGGTSFDAQYVNVNGQAGYFAHSLDAYGRQGEPCRRCGAPIVREAFQNRSSHFCPRCQRPPGSSRQR
ncbi:MAG: bifunctional DNA-formamidopyrimidine glycosylase/DNA-(apurinic or apyrimidinic site) lyase [Pseudoclavibacter sp.]|nr:bifunctional DNA-formamidopyrimidine glycosylase/DNA-(apurinic or apyrimidinic site) lyase [Pseudoclavibacter sp.]